MQVASFTFHDAPFGGDFAPELHGDFAPELHGDFAPELHGDFVTLRHASGKMEIML